MDYFTFMTMAAPESVGFHGKLNGTSALSSKISNTNTLLAFNELPIDDTFMRSAILTEQIGNNENKKKRSFQDDDVKRRADQSRAASLKYRRRKKERSDQLEKEYALLKEEREKLLEVKTANEQLLRVVSEENEQLRAKTSKHKVIDEKREVLETISSFLNEQESHELNAKLLDAIYRYREICTQLKTNSLPKLNLSTSDPTEYILSTSALFSANSCDRYALAVSEPSIRMNTLVNKLSQSVENLRPDQLTAISMTAFEHQTIIEELRKERSKFSIELSSILKDGNKSTDYISQRPGLNVLISMATQVRSLQKMAEKEILLWEKALDALLQHLTPKQQASYIIQQEFECSCMDYLKVIWSSLNGSDSKPDTTTTPSSLSSFSLTSLGSLMSPSPSSALSSPSATPSPSPTTNPHKRESEDEFKFEL